MFKLDSAHVVVIAAATYMLLAEVNLRNDIIVVVVTTIDFFRVNAMVCIARFLYKLTSFQISALYISVVLVNRVLPGVAFLILCPVLMWPTARWTRLSAGVPYTGIDAFA